ncbi:hypothetical protein [Massilia sp. CCM 8734]|uniref:hypothetical protein n=1 Tax=Massilia sp. CCM 8734 TaxID=2609283 RepID=UPI001422228C|nr:hypothetical protein [Massilia sp. CCM 8734]NHZ99038.1 hypothetical protein [Massilia sp. CCM 8734]
MNFRDERRLSLRLPTDIRKWIEHQAGLHKMTMTDYALQLLAKGIQAETVDETVTRIKEASQSGPALEMLRQTLAIRHIVEQLARGKVSMTEKISTDALVWADKELTRLFPERSAS